MRQLAAIRWLLLVLVTTAAPAFGQFAGGPDPHALAGFAREVGLEDVRGFVSTVETLRETGRLPDRYVTKEAARAHGWRGGGLCSVWPGQLIGGDIYRNLSEELPTAPGRLWREADLDATCRSRGPKRLIFSSDGLIYVTVDHYNFFTPVP
jgi:ribonuclease T1